MAKDINGTELKKGDFVLCTGYWKGSGLSYALVARDCWSYIYTWEGHWLREIRTPNTYCLKVDAKTVPQRELLRLKSGMERYQESNANRDWRYRLDVEDFNVQFSGLDIAKAS